MIIVSSDDSIHRAVNEFGASDIILKPFDIETLVEKVDCYLTPKIVPLYGEKEKNTN